VELNGARIRCYLDGQLVHDATAASSQNFFVVGGTDTATGDLILKAINIGDGAVSGTFNLGGMGHVRNGTVTVLKSASLSDNNSLDEPGKVAPVESRIAIAGQEFSNEFSPHSLSILRLKTR
jgi:alpha-L-arabinofuranosidase